MSIPQPTNLRFTTADLLVMCALVVVVFATRMAYMPPVIAHSDGGEYAFALDHFDIAAGHPHAPGYPLFVAFAKAFYLFVTGGDANGALVLASTVLSALGCCALYWWGAAMYGRTCGLMAAALLCFDNNYWRLGDMWMSYTAEAFWGSLLGLACLRSLRRPGGWTLGGALLLGIGGGFRQQLLSFLGPMWLWAARRSRWWQVAGGLGIIAAVTGAWILGASHASGGYAVFKASNDAQWREVIYPGSVFFAFSHGPAAGLHALGGRIANWWNLLFGGRTHLTVLAWLLPGLVGATLVFRPRALLRDDRSQLLALWLVPALVFHWTVHMNSRCHAAFYYPALFIIAGVGVTMLSRWAGRRGAPRRVVAAVFILTACALNVGLFVMRTGPAGLAEARGVQSVVGYISRFAPQRTVVVQSDARMYYYAVQYYLPQYRSYQLEQTLEPSRPSMMTQSPVKLGRGVDTVIFLNSRARVAGGGRVVRLANGFEVKLRRLRPEERYMHFSSAGVSFGQAVLTLTAADGTASQARIPAVGP